MKISTIGAMTLALGLTLPFAGAQTKDAHDSFAKLPATAIGSVIDQEKGWAVQELGRGLYNLNDGTYQMMFLTTGKGVIVVDAPPNTGKKILAAIASVINSHAHKDHIGAASLYPANAVIIAHEGTAAHLTAKNDPGRPLPTKKASRTK